ncbi:unnamed protein product [Prunus brigantina]
MGGNVNTKRSLNQAATSKALPKGYFAVCVEESQKKRFYESRRSCVEHGHVGSQQQMGRGGWRRSARSSHLL